MSTRLTRGLALALASLTSLARSAETGDIDGDGRISIKDSIDYHRGVEAAPGAIDAFRAYPCFVGDELRDRQSSVAGWMIHGSIYHESLRRSVDDPMPGWLPFWPGRHRQAPLSVSGDVLVRVLPVRAPGGDDDRVRFCVELESARPIQAFSLVFGATGGSLLKARYAPRLHGNWFGNRSWSTAANFVEEAGDLSVRASVVDQFVAGGRYVINFNVQPFRPLIAAGGPLRIITTARLDRGTAAGEYDVSVHPGSEVLLANGDLVSPTVEDFVGPELVIEKDVTAGWIERRVPLDLDEDTRQVNGRIEFRATRAEGEPGDVVSVRVQMRTSVPVNRLEYRVEWPPGVLRCRGRRALLRNPRDSRVYEPVGGNATCSDGGLLASGGRHSTRYHLAGYRDYAESAFPDRLLEFLEPLDEWVDVAEFDVEILDRAAGGDTIPIRFQRYDYEAYRAGDGGPGPIAQWYPFAGVADACGREFWGEGDEGWRYQYSFLDGEIRVLGDSEGEVPAAADGLRVTLGDATGLPGELVDVPIFVASSLDLSAVQIGVETDPNVAIVESIVGNVTSDRDGRLVPAILERGGAFRFVECNDDPQPICWNGVPFFVRFEDSNPSDSVLRFVASADGAAAEGYLSESFRELGRLRVRIQPAATGGTATIRVGEAFYRTNELGDLKAYSGGYLPVPDQDTFLRAGQLVDGVLAIAGADPEFRRGDANRDGRADLSDAVAVLSFLFLGAAELSCEDGGDVDDSGDLNISDSIFLLSHLFLGGPPVPAPADACGRDPTDDLLGCESSCVEP